MKNRETHAAHPKPASGQGKRTTFVRSRNPKCSGKRQFKDEIEAMLVLAKISRKDSSGRPKTEKRPYLCEHCKKYHLTSWEQPPAWLNERTDQQKAENKFHKAPQIEVGLVILLNEMFSSLGSTEEYNANVARRIQQEVDAAPTLIERIIRNSIQENYMDSRAAAIIAEVVLDNIK